MEEGRVINRNPSYQNKECGSNISYITGEEREKKHWLFLLGLNSSNKLTETLLRLRWEKKTVSSLLSAAV